MEIKFFNISKYYEIFKEYEYGKIVDLIENNRNIYVYGDSLHAYIYDSGKYIKHYQETDLTEIMTKVEVCYSLSRFESDTDIFTEIGFMEVLYDKRRNNEASNM